MQYRIISNGDKFRVEYRSNRFLPWTVVGLPTEWAANREDWDNIDQARRAIEVHKANEAYDNREWKVIEKTYE